MSRFIDSYRERFGVEPVCRTLGVSASAYYQRAAGQRSPRQIEDERLSERIRELHRANYEAYGYRRIWRALQRQGEDPGRDRVARLMRSAGIAGAKRRGKPWRTTKPDPEAHRRPDLVNRDFTASAPNELWVADLSYLRCWEGILFFAFIVDAFSRMVVGWQLAQNMRTTLVLDALKMALGMRGPGADVALVHHSDQGSQPGFNRSSQRCVGEGECTDRASRCWLPQRTAVRARLLPRRPERVARGASGDSRVRVICARPPVAAPSAGHPQSERAARCRFRLSCSGTRSTPQRASSN